MGWYRILPILLVVSVAGAGCISDSQVKPSGEANTQEDAEYEKAPGTQNQTVEELPIRTEEFEWDGYVSEQVGFCMTVCQGIPSPTTLIQEEDRHYEIGTKPLPTSATFTLTWDGPHAEMQEMGLAITKGECSDGFCPLVAYEIGPSGVTVSEPGLNLSQGDDFGVFVWHPLERVGDGGFKANVAVDFIVQGEYEVFEPRD